MFLKKIKNITVAFLLIIIIPLNVFAYSDKLIAGGQNVGIQINSNGVLVIGTYKIGEVSPAADAGIRIGDEIVKVNNINVNSIDNLLDVIDNIKNESLSISYIRNNSEYTTKLDVIKLNGEYKTGLYVKDKISGIGTLTFIDPETKIFGALGHEIIEKNSGKILKTNSGIIYQSTVTGIKKSNDGSPGEKKATYNIKNVFGNVLENTKSGIFGNYTNEISEGELYTVANSDDIKLGKAIIRTVVDKDVVEEFEIQITKINNKSDTKNIIFTITDQELISKTGGIVQGMSGSPIIQGDYIIGAVTHVIVDNPVKGYGIFITNMLEEAEN